MARGQWLNAIAAASIFDHTGPADFLPFIPRSLDLRRQAALALGDRQKAAGYEQRLALYGSTHPTHAFASPSSTQEGL